MNKVHILDPHVISKIAAGEVIERPASVVKELLENALDAQADQIEIHLQDAGTKLIHIKDNGHGIEQDDLPRIFLRHATSKITSADDLHDIHTLGFRGEALYSIAAIADVKVQSKTAGQETGWLLHMRGNEEMHTGPCAFNDHGTEIKITELFFNTPARKKFLKSNTTEINQILNIVIPFTLLYPSVRFLLTHQGKRLIDLAPDEHFEDRVATVLKLNRAHILAQEHRFEDKACDVRILIGDINITRPRRDLQYIFINQRPVDSKAIGYHMNNIFRLVMPDGRFPFFCVYLTVPADSVDVNVHPTKREVKIHGEQGICHILRAMTEDLLMSQGSIRQAQPTQRAEPAANDAPQPYELPPVDKSNFIAESLRRRYSSSDTFDAVHPRESHDAANRDPYAYPREPREISPEADPHLSAEEPMLFGLKNSARQDTRQNLQTRLSEARYVGPFRKKFLLFESGTSLLIVDQHAAQERIVYEQLIRQMNKSSIEVQHLMTPVSLKVTPQEMTLWEDVQEKLAELGFETSQWGDDAIAVHTHPQLIKDTERAVRHILGGENIRHCDFETLARRACRSSIMAGDKMSPQQAEFQREQLLTCLDPFTCPHGRPTVIEMSEDFLDKQFLRT